MDNSFLQQTAQTIVAQNNWSALEHITLVLPSHRAGVAVSYTHLTLPTKALG